MSVQIDPLPPVPQHTPPLDGPGDAQLTRKTPFSVTWMSWFLQLKLKVDTINGILVNLASLTGTGILAKINPTTWAVRTITGTANRINVANGDGVAGDPTITIPDTTVTPGSYTNTSITVGADGRITLASNGVPTGSSLTVGASWYSATVISQTLAGFIDRPCPVGGTIVGVTVVTQGGSGSCVLDIMKSTYAAFPPVTSICAAAKPTLSTNIKYTDTTLTGWTTTVTDGDVLRFEIESTSVFTQITIILEIAP